MPSCFIQVEIDNIISNTDEWQTWPGYATLAFRLIVMVWFLVELRRTYHHSHQDNVNFIQHFGAFFLMWFIYLPVLALISTQVSPLWRYKTILSRWFLNSVWVKAVGHWNITLVAHTTAHLNAKSFWWWKCSVRCSLPLPPPPPSGILHPTSTSPERLSIKNVWPKQPVWMHSLHLGEKILFVILILLVLSVFKTVQLVLSINIKSMLWHI